MADEFVRLMLETPVRLPGEYYGGRVLMDRRESVCLKIKSTTEDAYTVEVSTGATVAEVSSVETTLSHSNAHTFHAHLTTRDTFLN